MRGLTRLKLSFAGENCLEDVDCDGIYRLFVEHQSQRRKSGCRKRGPKVLT